jgi:hypothetical protein
MECGLSALCSVSLPHPASSGNCWPGIVMMLISEMKDGDTEVEAGGSRVFNPKTTPLSYCQIPLLRLWMLTGGL